MPEVWAIGLIGFCTYIASTGVTYLQPFLASIYNLDASTSSIYAIIAKNCALVAAPIMTWIATKKKVPVTKVLGLSLLIAAVCFVLFIIFPQNANLLVLAIVLYMAAALCIMATWAMQFTPVSEVGIPMAVTGSAIGVISMFSFVSDIFYSAVCGFFIDNYALNGYKWIFGMTNGAARHRRPRRFLHRQENQGQGPGLRLNHAPRTRKGPRGTADTAFFDISWGKTVNNFQLFIAKTDI